MPTLPAASQYTYAFEARLDEQGDARHVLFDEPVLSVLENFLSMPVGMIVPTGYYDLDLAAWVPMPDGRVVEIHAETGGIADLVIDESGLPADDLDLEALGITLEFREAIADRYAVGDSLWLVLLSHLSIIDENYPSDPETPPNQPEPEPYHTPPCPTRAFGSVIDCQSQTLGESIPISGTPWSLNYRVRGARYRERGVRWEIESICDLRDNEPQTAVRAREGIEALAIRAGETRVPPDS